MWGLGVLNPMQLKVTYNFWFPQNLSCPSVFERDLFQEPPRLSQSVDAPVPYIKWCRSMHTVSPPHLRTSNLGSKTVHVFIEIHPHRRGHTQLK